MEDKFRRHGEAASPRPSSHSGLRFECFRRSSRSSKVSTCDRGFGGALHRSDATGPRISRPEPAGGPTLPGERPS